MGTLTHRLDVAADGTVTIAAAAAGSTYCALDGVSFSTKADNSVDWLPLLSTLTSNPAGLTTATGFQQPQYSLEGSRVFLRGLYTGNLVNDTLLGLVPSTLRPQYAHSFPVMANNGSVT